ncbi:DMT family transporter [Gordonia terrae]|uniref:DMT family transporter n=1 Tax=Gordonia hongkongensis TaxID=1701090 RepID=UPI0022B51960|nr:DMT family transporter [Gordonia terrae]
MRNERAALPDNETRCSEGVGTTAGKGPAIWRRWAPLTVSLIAGVGVAVQTFLNARLGAAVGSVDGAAAISSYCALVVAVVLGIASGAVVRAWKTVRRRGVRIRFWWVLCGMLGTFAMWVNTGVAPLTGIALLSIASLLGKLLGGLLVDMIGLSPRGKVPTTWSRVIGALLALASVVIGSLDSRAGEFLVLPLTLVVVASALVSVQLAGNAYLSATTSEPLAMSTSNFLMGALLMTAVLAVKGAPDIPPVGQLPPWFMLAGVTGVGIALAGAYAVQRVGVMALLVVQIGGQLIGAVVLDLVFPVGEVRPNLLTGAGVALAMAAVWATTRNPRAPDRARVRTDRTDCARG